jgi:hypothetical protein
MKRTHVSAPRTSRLGLGNASSIAEQPIRRIDFARSSERESHDQIVRIVGDLTRSIVRRTTAPSAQDRSIAGRRAEGLPDQLEDIVLDIYGITGAANRREIMERGERLG